MYTDVCVMLGNLGVPEYQSQPQTVSCFKVRIVLLKIIDGYELWDLATAPGGPADLNV